ncbi:hypothetical protein [Afifella sp. IM 167]|uniref:hypothetical protein n=1 Tax=Afifella sp. IM 167 TaxID=2033586 RepID=UPI001CCF320D|nr:hypothetical protein [Afifella sp. IM 167]MBZ8134192.1 hypothetical protein [Afifella sp. IM 167]
MRKAILLLGLFLLAAAPGAEAAGCSGTPEECEVDSRLDMAGIDKPEEARAFLARLKQAAAADDREALAGMVRYPLNVYGPGKPKTYGNAKALLADFDKVFTPGVKTAISEATYGSLFIRDQGAMIGNGEVWFDGADGKILIKTINPPDQPDASAAPADPGKETAEGAMAPSGRWQYRREADSAGVAVVTADDGARLMVDCRGNSGMATITLEPDIRSEEQRSKSGEVWVGLVFDGRESERVNLALTCEYGDCTAMQWKAPTNGEALGIRTHLDLNAALRRFGDVRLYLEDRPLEDYSLKGSAAAIDRLRSVGGCPDVY